MRLRDDSPLSGSSFKEVKLAVSVAPATTLGSSGAPRGRTAMILVKGGVSWMRSGLHVDFGGLSAEKELSRVVALDAFVLDRTPIEVFRSPVEGA